MPFSPRNGHRTITIPQIRAISPFEQKSEDIEYSAGNYKSKTMQLGIVTHTLRCRFSGTYTVGGSTSTLKPFGALHLIKNLDVFMNTSDKNFSLPGFDLQNLHTRYNGKAPFKLAEANTVGTHNFEYAFDIPVDAGDYFSCISAIKERAFSVGVNFGNVDDMATAGGTHSISNCKLQVTQVGVVGQDDKEPGGRHARYMKHIMSYQYVPITASNPKLKIDLNNDVWYSGLSIYAFSNGVLVDTIVNEAKLSVYTNQALPRTWNDIRDRNYGDYGIAPTGVRHLDIGRKEHVEDLIVVSGPDRLQLLLDVNTVATDELYIVEDTFQEPAAA